MASEVEIPLANAIRALRQEIVAAVRAAGEEDIRFALGPVELELQVEAARETGGEAGIKFWLVSIGGRDVAGAASDKSACSPLTPTFSICSAA